MHNNKNFKHRFLPAFIVSLSSTGLSSMVQAEIMLYDKDQTTFSTDGYINAFYVNSNVDRAGDQYDRRQARVKMGFCLTIWVSTWASRSMTSSSAPGPRSG